MFGSYKHCLFHSLGTCTRANMAGNKHTCIYTCTHAESLRKKEMHIHANSQGGRDTMQKKKICQQATAVIFWQTS